MMMVNKVYYVLILQSMIVVVQSRMRFKIINRCERKNDVTILLNFHYDLPTRNKRESKAIFNENHRKIIRTLIKDKDEACLDLSLVTISPVLNKYSFDIFSGESITRQLKHRSHDTDLKEYLHFFDDTTQSQKKTTLAIFTADPLEQDHLDLLYRLQTEKNVAVIIVSLSADISHLEQFPPHLKFYVFYANYHDQVVKQIVDVIKNPNFDRFQFNKQIPNFRDRSCLQNVKNIILVYIEQNGYRNSYFIEETVLPKDFFKYYRRDDTDQRILKFFQYSFGGPPIISKYYTFKTVEESIKQLTDDGMTEENKQNIFLIVPFVGCNKDQHIKSNIKVNVLAKYLEQHKKIVLRYELKTYSTLLLKNSVITEFICLGNINELRRNKQVNMNDIVDKLIDLGCK